jgi:hypothetical protein
VLPAAFARDLNAAGAGSAFFGHCPAGKYGLLYWFFIRF